jgi:hypothetical protein
MDGCINEWMDRWRTRWADGWLDQFHPVHPVELVGSLNMTMPCTYH